MKILFDESTHTYTDETGLVYPSVSQIIETGGMKGMYKPPIELMLEAAEFGKSVHKLLELYDTDNLGEYDKALDPWREGWAQFKQDHPNLGNIVIDIKTGGKQKWHALQTVGYALLLNENFENEECPDQIESPLRSKMWAFCGTPDRAYLDINRLVTKRWAVYIDGKNHKGGKKYMLEKHEEWPDANDHMDIFIGLVQAYHWKVKYNLL